MAKVLRNVALSRHVGLFLSVHVQLLRQRVAVSLHNHSSLLRVYCLYCLLSFYRSILSPREGQTLPLQAVWQSPLDWPYLGISLNTKVDIKHNNLTQKPRNLCLFINLVKFAHRKQNGYNPLKSCERI